MIKKEGMVALQHYTSNPWTVEVDREIYSFVPRHNVSMAWIKEEHVDRLLTIMTKACCGRNQHRFHRASEVNINLWETGNRYGSIDTV